MDYLALCVHLVSDGVGDPVRLAHLRHQALVLPGQLSLYGVQLRLCAEPQGSLLYKPALSRWIFSTASDDTIILCRDKGVKRKKLQCCGYETFSRVRTGSGKNKREEISTQDCNTGTVQNDHSKKIEDAR